MKQKKPVVTIYIQYGEDPFDDNNTRLVEDYDGPEEKAGYAFMRALQKAQADPEAREVTYTRWEHQRQENGSMQWVWVDRVEVPVIHLNIPKFPTN